MMEPKGRKEENVARLQNRFHCLMGRLPEERHSIGFSGVDECVDGMLASSPQRMEERVHMHVS
jgi:hypothetical protein